VEKAPTAAVSANLLRKTSNKATPKGQEVPMNVILLKNEVDLE
jgi:hypothetical protein